VTAAAEQAAWPARICTASSSATISRAHRSRALFASVRPTLGRDGAATGRTTGTRPVARRRCRGFPASGTAAATTGLGAGWSSTLRQRLTTRTAAAAATTTAAATQLARRAPRLNLRCRARERGVSARRRRWSQVAAGFTRRGPSAGVGRATPAAAASSQAKSSTWG
jgi:hypothetical protein